jgi:trehalose 6-phosphate phosphatase
MSTAADGSASLEAVIFDLDGVVTLTASVHAAAWKRLFDEFLERRAKETGEPFVPFDLQGDYPTYVDGKPRIEGVKSFLASREIELPEGTPEDGPDESTAWGLGNRKNTYFQTVLDERGAEVDARTVSFIRRLLAAGVRVAVASSSKNCGPILDRAGLADLFEARVDGVVSEEIGLKGKPHPDIFVEAARRIGAMPERTVVVEDAISGVQAGRAGGFGLVIGIDRVGAAAALREHGADLVLTSFDDRSFELIEEWFANREQRRPSALREWDDLRERLRGRRPALFLDYDGTLTPIVSRPELAVLSDESRAVLERIAARYPTAIISGRGRDNVERLVGLPELAYAGSHGFDIVGAGGTAVGHAVADWIEPVMNRVAEMVKPRLAGIDGALIEEKRFSIAVHYRLVEEALVPRIESIVDEAVATDARLKKAHGKKVFEVRPDVDWDKGKAVLFLAEVLGLNGPDVVPFYIGDDVTDEDAFKALRGRGIGIVVSEAPRPTEASYWVQAPWEVYAFFERLLSLEGGGG